MSTSCCTSESLAPKPYRSGFFDLVKLVLCYLRGFKATFSYRPGIYYTGDLYDPSAPLIVTGNYHLTVYNLFRVLKKRAARVLVIDTKGINVWCSSGKGQFSSELIISTLNRFEPSTVTTGGKLRLILPKLSLSGVSLQTLRNNLINPVIGPVYMKDLLAFLDGNFRKSVIGDKYLFNLKDRLFILTPSLIQFSLNLIIVTAVTVLINLIFKTGVTYQPFVIGILTGATYIVLFPVLPTKFFSVKGLVLSIIPVTFLSLSYFTGNYSGGLLNYLFYSIYYVAIGLWFGLYFTGNSGVSNYSIIKREIMIFLPITFALLLAGMITLILKGVLHA